MNLGIVGSEASKFTVVTEKLAVATINGLLKQYDPDIVISGACHLGGVDRWAIDEARDRGYRTLEFHPHLRKWEGGYKQRNLLIADRSDVVICITLKEYPEYYSGIRFPICYHCGVTDHIKSGGCWTVKQAIEKGKKGEIIVI